MRIVIAAGGTGGHIIPALTIAHDLRALGHKITWLGLRTGFEADLVPRAGFKIKFLPGFGGIRGKSLMSLISSPLKLFRAVLSSLWFLKKHKPSGIITMGGYVCGPVGVAAWLLNIPIVIHEQNSVAGTTNRLLTRLSDNILSAYPSSFSKDIDFLHVGNPIREKFVNIGTYKMNPDFPNKINIVVTGGSLGAQQLNDVIFKFISDIQFRSKVNLVHQTGAKDFTRINEKYKTLDDCSSIEVLPYIHDIEEKYKWADLVISRAGAMSISEILACQMPSILVPYPHATDNHQYYNAKELANVNAALLVSQDDFNTLYLKVMISKLLMGPEELQKLSDSTKILFQSGANTRIATYCLTKFS
ncbi:MAG: undecaprenyldiphospho-muramoylpentapeptide beta-N-acetylglucosaminyltransferase [Francisellaceae bacterium]|jgi:UDP-N-acetylglucosamine--N-acetylmuramyl-(pentapeptide) pyrophosphoryl-undecaprenol N-acetylglucosamine transferase|nr:undecaprenyldiphospho-muramoylpentapeptide beta-N-acetylglucosaminyltransferase [Francisellaceae bacterium]MBT6207477.1 undecaprenyldiphospho-muramoylpentapeptide beta-N-acetylglucosaminyltransferase [Francisellaceae bacterium]MBT6539238.1 undecaprenyldiphospho-muramoylpentapeptide beta-N-acetylglucosaminyltransferase [Francisellaceae bacterium]